MSEGAIILPVHLKGTKAMEEAFGVSRRTVRAWIGRGAPIYLVGRKYQTNYSELWAWLTQDGTNAKSCRLRPRWESSTK